MLLPNKRENYSQKGRKDTCRSSIQRLPHLSIRRFRKTRQRKWKGSGHQRDNVGVCLRTAVPKLLHDKFPNDLHPVCYRPLHQGMRLWNSRRLGIKTREREGGKRERRLRIHSGFRHSNADAKTEEQHFPNFRGIIIFSQIIDCRYKVVYRHFLTRRLKHITTVHLFLGGY